MNFDFICSGSSWGVGERWLPGSQKWIGIKILDSVYNQSPSQIIDLMCFIQLICFTGKVLVDYLQKGAHFYVSKRLFSQSYELLNILD